LLKTGFKLIIVFTGLHKNILLHKTKYFMYYISQRMYAQSSFIIGLCIL